MAAPDNNHKENEVQTYIFTVAVNGEDVQDAAEQLREGVIDIVRAQTDGNADVDVQVTDSVRVTP